MSSRTPLPGRASPGGAPRVTQGAADIEALVATARESASAYIAGDVRRYFELVRPAADFTLMSPFGGEPVREPAGPVTEERLDALEEFFHGGQCVLDVVACHASGDLAVLVVVERQHGHVGHRPPQDWSLRVTLVFRYDAGAWRLLHRHADPLVRPITFDRLGELAAAAGPGSVPR